jgi:cell division protein FtsQ
VNAKTTIRKVFFVALWLCIGGGMLTLLLAAISKKNKGQCKDYSISIKGVYNNFFIDKKDIEQLLMKGTNSNIKGEQISTFKLHELEQMLENNNWIDEAELYFDNRDVLHISVTEKEPVARLFTTTGNSFYIDGLGRKMPLSDKLSARVPVFTGFPEKKKLNTADSALLNDVRVTANYIINDPFWMSQVSQIDITADRNFEMIPVVGNHLVRLGNGEDIDKKFNRLMVFYKQVLSKTGFDKYRVIDVQYKGQVVVTKYAGDAKVDSIQLRKNVEKLLRQSMDAENDTIIRVMKPNVQLEADSASSPDPSLKDITELNSEQPNPNPLKSALSKPTEQKTDKPKPAKNEKPKPAENTKMPKAVMPEKQSDNGNE